MVRMRVVGLPVLVLGLASGLVYAMMQIHDLTFEVKELRSRLSRSESAAPRLESTTTVVNLPSSPSSADGDLASEVARLSAELAALRSALGVAPTEVVVDASPAGEGRFVAVTDAPSTVVVGKGQGTVALEKMTPEQQEAFKKAVLQVVAEKNQADQQKQRLLMTNRVLDELAKALGLAGPQLDRAKQILADGTARVADLRKQMNDANQKQTQKDISAVWKSMDQSMRSLLTAEQASQYDTWRTTKIAKNYFGPPASAQRPAPKPAKPGNGKRG